MAPKEAGCKRSHAGAWLRLCHGQKLGTVGGDTVGTKDDSADTMADNAITGVSRDSVELGSSDSPMLGKMTEAEGLAAAATKADQVICAHLRTAPPPPPPPPPPPAATLPWQPARAWLRSAAHLPPPPAALPRPAACMGMAAIHNSSHCCPVFTSYRVFFAMV